MKKLFCFAAALTLFLLSGNGVFAHHIAEGIVDEEVYAMIDALVADTPHVTIDIGDMGETIIEAESIKFLEDMIDQGLMDYFSMLDGDVTVTIEYDNDTRTAVMTITQME